MDQRSDTPDPRPWRQLSAPELDEAYDQARHAPDMADVLAACADASARVRVHLPPERIAYGACAGEAMDWYPAEQPGGPWVFFVHGGAWRRGHSADYGLGADWLTRQGAHFVVPDFDSVIDADGRLERLLMQLQSALAAARREAERRGADPEALVLCGHSSGAHLAACLAMHTPPGTPLPRALVCCSGLYDLEPVSHSARSSYVRFDAGTIEQLSPCRHAARFTMPVTLLTGTGESPEFIRQARDWRTDLLSVGAATRLHEVAGLDHFRILHSLASEDGVFARELRAAVDTARA